MSIVTLYVVRAENLVCSYADFHSLLYIPKKTIRIRSLAARFRQSGNQLVHAVVRNIDHTTLVMRTWLLSTGASGILNLIDKEKWKKK